MLCIIVPMLCAIENGTNSELHASRLLIVGQVHFECESVRVLTVVLMGADDVIMVSPGIGRVPDKHVLVIASVVHPHRAQQVLRVAGADDRVLHR